MTHLPRFGTLVLVASFISASALLAAETDQYQRRNEPLNDARELINEHVNESIEKALSEYEGKADNYKLERKIRWAVEGTLYFHRLAFWIKGNPDIDHTDTRKYSIYKGIKLWQSIMPLTGTISSTININGVRTGTDKISHMFYVGWTYYKKFRKHGLEAALKAGPGTEKGILGWYTTGVYSNGDIVTNYEGMLFYQGIFQDGVVQGKPALVRWDGNKPVLQRKFDIADHVNLYWDESINGNQYRGSVARFVTRKLKSDLCPQFRADPSLWAIDEKTDAELEARYAVLNLWNPKQYRLQNICAETP